MHKLRGWIQKVRLTPVKDISISVGICHLDSPTHAYE